VAAESVHRAAARFNECLDAFHHVRVVILNILRKTFALSWE